MKSIMKKLIRKVFNSAGFDIIRKKIPSKHTLLGLEHLPIRSVIDVGANTGGFARMILGIFPEAHIYSFEPLPAPFKELSKWVKNQNGRIKAFNIALGDKEGDVKMFYHLKHSPSSSLLKSTEVCERLYPVMKKQISISIKLTTLDQVIASISELLIPDVLIKIDVQGYEDRVIRGGRETFRRRAKALILEVGLDSLYENQPTYKDILFLLDELGYRYVGNVSQVYADDGHVIYIDAVFMK